MSKSYGSKVDLNAKPEVARINKVEAQDFNDIAGDMSLIGDFRVTKGTVLRSSSNQGITNDGTYYYVSASHNLIEKRKMSDYSLVDSNVLTNQLGGVFYDSIADVIYTVGGTYNPPYSCLLSKINKTTLAIDTQYDITSSCTAGVNAVVRYNDSIYVGETAVGQDTNPKHWYEFTLTGNFVKTVYSVASVAGRNDFQDATVFDDKIFATDHEGYLQIFTVNDAGLFVKIYDVCDELDEGITYISGTKFVAQDGLITAMRECMLGTATDADITTFIDETKETLTTSIDETKENVFTVARSMTGYRFNSSGDKIVAPFNTKNSNIFDNGGTIIANINPQSSGGNAEGSIYFKGCYLKYLVSKLTFKYYFDGNSGRWQMTEELPFNQEYNIAVTYDNLASNDPVMYIDGNVKPLNEIDTPSGTRKDDSDRDITIGHHPTSNAYTFDGSIFNVTTFNKILTADEIERFRLNKELDYKYIGASQVTVATGSFVIGKEYRIVTVGDTDFISIGASADTIGEEFVATGVGDGTTGEATQIGCINRYDTEGTETNQWKDISGNVAIGDVTGADVINKWNKTESVEYIVTTSKTFILPKDFIITNIMYENESGNTGDLEIGFGAGTNEIVNQTSIATGTVSSIHATVGKAVNADDIIYITTTQEMTVKVLMERV